MSDRAFNILTVALITVLTAIVAVLAYLILASRQSADPNFASNQCQTFPQTNQTVCGTFLAYWNDHGGIARQGLPISAEFEEVSPTDGMSYTVQYFERTVMEHHPENQPPYDVLLSLLGALQFNRLYPSGVTAVEPLPAGMNPEGGAVFPQTGKEVRGIFLDYWLNNGGTLQFGYPISDAFVERSQIDGLERIVQYFERSVFEYHPENQPPDDVQVALLGRFRQEELYPNGPPGATTPILSPTATNTVVSPPSGTPTLAATSTLSPTSTVSPTLRSTAVVTSTPTAATTPSSGPTARLLFSDGFESGDFSAWSGGAVASSSRSQAEVIAAAAYDGSWGAHFSNGSGGNAASGSYWSANFAVPASHKLAGQARIKINSAAGTGSFRVLHLRDEATQNSVLRVQYSNGNWQLAMLQRDGTTTAVNFANGLPIGSWQLLEVTYDWSGAQPIGKAYLGGKLEATITDTTTGPSYNPNSIYCLVYEDATTALGDAYFDDVKAADHYIGP
jgi:hypothetical protein